MKFKRYFYFLNVDKNSVDIPMIEGLSVRHESGLNKTHSILLLYLYTSIILNDLLFTYLFVV